MPALAERSDDRDLGVLAQKLRALKQDAPAAASLRTALKPGRGSKNDSAAVRNAIMYHNVEGVLDTLRAIEVLGPLFVELMIPESAELEQCQWDPNTLEAAWDAIKDALQALEAVRWAQA
ncbi:g4258 [Coccomyxa viridis]|uniref:G4258 protein n=1 Tax=Coccomyxa viridis TaxID=1274662 RepID=A0ABP1FSN2_9CHLO